MSRTAGRQFGKVSRHAKSQRRFLARQDDYTLSVEQVAATAAFLLSEPANGVYGRDIELGRNRST